MQDWACRTFALAVAILLASSISAATQDYTGIVHRNEFGYDLVARE